MYRLLGFFTQNTKKTLYVLEELGVDYEFQYVNLFKGENKTDEFLKANPLGKAPVLQHNDESIFESGAICRYLANVENSELYPSDKLKRAKVDQWMDFFSCHLGKWLSSLYFENIIKAQVAMGEPCPIKCEEAKKFALQQFQVIDNWLENHTYFIGEDLTIADLFAFAYVEQVKDYELSMNEFPSVNSWIERIESRESIQRAREKVKL